MIGSVGPAVSGELGTMVVGVEGGTAVVEGEKGEKSLLASVEMGLSFGVALFSTSFGPVPLVLPVRSVMVEVGVGLLGTGTDTEWVKS
jgi:hypothetical protein